MDTNCLRQVLDQVRENPSNQVCADCGMEGKIRLLWIPIVYDRCWTKSGKTPVTRCVLTVVWKVRSWLLWIPIVYDRCWTKSGKIPVTSCVLTVAWKVRTCFIMLCIFPFVDLIGSLPGIHSGALLLSECNHNFSQNIYAPPSPSKTEGHVVFHLSVFRLIRWYVCLP